ncbi:MAG: hypothetical protein HQ518_00410 [Rhodopirellula sp.]|nr:hypothetical protein [Rhodopirellula sp.]
MNSDCRQPDGVRSPAESRGAANVSALPARGWLIGAISVAFIEKDFRPGATDGTMLCEESMCGPDSRSIDRDESQKLVQDANAVSTLPV